MAEQDPGFLSRWSQRKLGVKQAEPAPILAPPPAPLPAPVPVTVAEPSIDPATSEVREVAEAPAPPPLTLDDVATLTPQSDYSRFVARNVDSPVRNAALKKLFADPQFNIMDGLDTYIDDYGKPDPIPDSMLRQMAQAQFLGLFADEDERTQPIPEQLTERLTEPTPDEDPDLRLQSHDAVGPPGPEQGPGQDPGGEH